MKIRKNLFLHNPTSLLASGGLEFPIPTFLHPLHPLNPKGGFTPPFYPSPGGQNGGAEGRRPVTFQHLASFLAFRFLSCFGDLLFSFFRCILTPCWLPFWVCFW